MVKKQSKNPGILQWLTRHDLIDLVFAAQEQLVDEEMRRVLPDSYLSIDSKPSRNIKLDDCKLETILELQALADKTYTLACQEHGNLLSRFLHK